MGGRLPQSLGLTRLVKSILLLVLISLFAFAYLSPSSFGVIQGHVPFVIQGHSPINLLVTDQSTGLETGCMDGVSVTYIPGSAYSGCGTDPQSVSILSPTVGSFIVEWVSTLSANEQGQFSITIAVCTNGHSDTLCSQEKSDNKAIIYTLVPETPIGSGDSGSSQFNYQSNGGIVLPTTTTSTETQTVIVPTTTTEEATATSTSTAYTTIFNTATASSETTIPVTVTTQVTTLSTTIIPATTSTTVTETTSTSSVTSYVKTTVTVTSGECEPYGDPYVISQSPSQLSSAATTASGTSSSSSTSVTTPTITVTKTVTSTSTSTTTSTTTSTSVVPTTSTSISDTTTTVIVPVTVTSTQTQTATSTVQNTVTRTGTVTAVPTTTVTRTTTKFVTTCSSDTDDNALQSPVPFSLYAGLVALVSAIAVGGYIFMVRGNLLGASTLLPSFKRLISKR